MNSRLLTSLSALIALLHPHLTGADCPPTASSSPIPGCWGQPGCTYVIVSDLGPGTACNFDYCNCGGTNVLLLPSTISGSATVGCDYTTQPTAENCPTGPPVLPGGGGGAGGSGTGGTGQPSLTPPSGGGGGGGGTGSGESGQSSITPPPGGSGGGNPPPLPTPVISGGPISTASDAFATSAPSVTTLSYSGGALTYTEATFTSLASLTSTSSITATVTKTASAGGAVQTYVGPVIVGPGGTFWGPPGTAPDCVWPFCSSSGPAPPPGGGTDGGTGGGAGGSFGCQGCNGGDGQNGQGGGSGGGGDGDGGEPAPPEACPGAKRIKRSDSDVSSNVRIVKREEEMITSNNPPKGRLEQLWRPSQRSHRFDRGHHDQQMAAKSPKWIRFWTEGSLHANEDIQRWHWRQCSDLQIRPVNILGSAL